MLVTLLVIAVILLVLGFATTAKFLILVALVVALIGLLTRSTGGPA